jgi:SnoaL-like domain
MDLWELAARERIRDTLARYSWSGDSLRLDEFAQAFCEDGELQLRGRDPVRGRSAIVEFLSGVAAPDTAATGSGVTRLVRHNVTNIRFLEITPQQARVTSYFTVFTDVGLDHHGRYRDTFVPTDDEWLIRHRFISTDWAAPESTMASPSARR